MKYAFPAIFLLLVISVFCQTTHSHSHEMVAIANSFFEWCEGGPGTLLATILLVGGAVIGVAHCGPGATMAGVVGAAAIHFGPFILFTISGLPTPPDSPAPVKQPAVHVASSTVTAAANSTTKSLNK